MSTGLTFSVAISTVSGPLELQNPAGGYEVHAETFSEGAVTFRKQQIESPYVEGSFPILAVRENIARKLSVWVDGTSPYDREDKIFKLTEALRQLQYTLTFTESDQRIVYSCSVADYNVTTDQAQRYAGIALVQATVPTLPTVTRSRV